jgi:cobalt transporter subunit CbtB
MKTQTIDTRSSCTDAQASSAINVLRGALCAALLGGLLIWGVGSSHIDVVHNAAHDARHSADFPCH